jgi:hypothetical protein
MEPQVVNACSLTVTLKRSEKALYPVSTSGEDKVV